MKRFLLLQLEGPLLSFGRETIDANGYVGDFPGASMLTGLLANAMGWARTETARLQRLQDGMEFAARIEREGTRILDYQTVSMGLIQETWTTRGYPSRTAGGPASSEGTHIRLREYDADKCVVVALSIDPEHVSIEECAEAVAFPARPLFLGRKPCVPTNPLRIDDPAGSATWEAESALDALLACPLRSSEAHGLRCRFVASSGQKTDDADRLTYVSDQRNWKANIHGGQREILTGRREFSCGGTQQ